MNAYWQGPWGAICYSSLSVNKRSAKTQGNYPAVKRILQVVENGLAHGCSSGYAEEARAFGELAMSPQSQALRSIFFASTDLKKTPAPRRAPVR